MSGVMEQEIGMEQGAVRTEEALGRLQERLRPLYARLAEHRLYRTFTTVEDLRIFMASHVFAVWDFMSLLKTLQRGLTCVEVPWVPRAFPESRRLVNEIVLGEESDIYEGEAISHFELYLRAMRACGASTAAVEEMLRGLAGGETLPEALKVAPGAAQRFMGETFALVEEGRLHAVAAAFTFGREDLIPEMFESFIRDQDARLSGSLGLFRWYLDRHIEVDGGEHGPMALRMITELCGTEAVRWSEAESAAVRALEARLMLWDGIAEELERQRAA